MLISYIDACKVEIKFLAVFDIILPLILKETIENKGDDMLLTWSYIDHEIILLI